MVPTMSGLGTDPEPRFAHPDETDSRLTDRGVEAPMGRRVDGNVGHDSSTPVASVYYMGETASLGGSLRFSHGLDGAILPWEFWVSRSPIALG